MKEREYDRLLASKMLSAASLALGKSFCNAISEYITPASRVLDVGCGFGVAATYVRAHTDFLTLVDVDRLALDFVSRKWGACNRIEISHVSDLNPLREFDVIYYFLSLHHIDAFEHEIGRSMARLSEGGCLFICELEPVEGSPFHIHEHAAYDGLSKERLCSALVNLGCSVVKSIDVGVIEKNVDYKVYLLQIQN